MKATWKGAGASAAEVIKLLSGSSYFYLSLALRNGGHAIGLHLDPKAGIQLMDPNGGLTAVGDASALLTDMITTYGATQVRVFAVEKIQK